VEPGEECNIYRIIGLVRVRRPGMLDLTNVKPPIETAMFDLPVKAGPQIKHLVHDS
jgi:hypothetical protein